MANKIAVFQREHNLLKRNGIYLQPESLYVYVRSERELYGTRFIGYVLYDDYSLNYSVRKAFEIFQRRHPELFKEKL